MKHDKYVSLFIVGVIRAYSIVFESGGYRLLIELKNVAQQHLPIRGKAVCPGQSL